MVAPTPSRCIGASKRWHSLALLVLTIAPWSTPLIAQGDAAAGQQAVIEIVRLQHRDPSQIRAAIAPHLDERGAISQIDNNLIISTSRANLAQLEELITELDIPRRQLRISVDFNYGRPPVPRTLDDATVTTTLSTSSPEDTVQTVIVTEGEFAHFSASSGNPVSGLNFTELAALLEQQRSPSAQSLTLTALPRGTGAVIEIAALQSAPDLNGNLQSRVISSTLEVGLNQWHVMTAINADPDPLSVPNPNAVIATTVQTEATAVRVEVLP